MWPLLLAVLLGAVVVHRSAPRPARPSATVVSVVASSYAVDFRLQLAGARLPTLRALTGPGLAVGVEGGLPVRPAGPLRVRVAIPSCARLPGALEPGTVRSPARLLDLALSDTGPAVTLRVGGRAAPQLYAAVRALAGRVCPAGSYRLPG